jgi:hypothetical protein
LTSTKKENDYVHRLVRRIAETDSISVKFSIVNIAEFERTFIQHGFEISKLSNVQYKDPDYLIVQIGENVGKADIKGNPAKYEYGRNRENYQDMSPEEFFQDNHDAAETFRNADTEFKNFKKGKYGYEKGNGWKLK